MLSTFKVFEGELEELNKGNLWINTINAYSYNISRKDVEFDEALKKCNILLPDGISIIWAKRILEGKKIKKIAGFDYFYYIMNYLQNRGGSKVFFLGSSQNTLEMIKIQSSKKFPKIEVHTYSPPFKKELSIEDSQAMINSVNQIKPDVLFVGMTAPKQEKWVYKHYHKLKASQIACIGAVFDFFAETKKRAPMWMINLGFEWFYRWIIEPRRLSKRYIIGNICFVFFVFLEKYRKTLHLLRNFNRKDKNNSNYNFRN